MYDVKKAIASAIKSYSKKDGINPNDIRVKIGKSNGSLTYTLMDKTREVRATTLKEVLGIGMVDVLGVEKTAFEYLWESMNKIIEENGLNEDANVRVYAKKDFKIAAHLFDGTRSVKTIDIDELT